MSKQKSRIRIVHGQRMKLSMRHRILIVSSVAACLVFISGLWINVGDSENAVAGNQVEIKTTKPVPERTEASITVKACYPNPFSGSFSYDFVTPTSTTAELSVFNADGQEIKKIQVYATPGINSIKVIDDCNMKPGIYYAILKSNNNKYVQRLEKN